MKSVWLSTSTVYVCICIVERDDQPYSWIKLMHSYMLATACSPRSNRSVVEATRGLGRSQMSVSLSTRSSKFNDPLPHTECALQMRLIYFGLSAEDPVRDWGCVRARGWSSHNQGRRAVRDHCQIWKSRPSKKRRNFSFPLFFPIHHLLLPTPLPLAYHRSESK